jgi:hypothetical protein
MKSSFVHMEKLVLGMPKVIVLLGLIVQKGQRSKTVLKEVIAKQAHGFRPYVILAHFQELKVGYSFLF